MNKIRKVASIVKNHVQWLAIREGSQGLFDTPDIFFLRLALPCENRHTSCSDTGLDQRLNEMFVKIDIIMRCSRRRSMILRGVNVLQY